MTIRIHGVILAIFIKFLKKLIIIHNNNLNFSAESAYERFIYDSTKMLFISNC
jgi:hypothetical protein